MQDKLLESVQELAIVNNVSRQLFLAGRSLAAIVYRVFNDEPGETTSCLAAHEIRDCIRCLRPNCVLDNGYYLGPERQALHHGEKVCYGLICQLIVGKGDLIERVWDESW